MAEKAQTVAEVFDRMGDVFDADKASGMDAIYQFDLTGDGGGKYWVKVANSQYEVNAGEHDSPSITVIASAADYISIVNGDLAAMSAFMTGKLKVKGDMGLAMKLQSIFPTS